MIRPIEQEHAVLFGILAMTAAQNLAILDASDRAFIHVGTCKLDNWLRTLLRLAALVLFEL